jgi:hypothetical protein
VFSGCFLDAWRESARYVGDEDDINPKGGIMGLAAEVVQAEREGWQELSAGRGAQHYRQHLTDDALMAFSFGVLDREQAIESIEAAPPWASFEMSDVRVIEVTTDSAVVVYRVQARRAGEEPYDAMVASVFARQDGVWKLAFHQQTPTS